MLMRTVLLVSFELGSIATLVVRPATAAPPSVQVKDLGTLGGRFTVANDINDAGEIIGRASDPAGTRVAIIASPTHR